MSEDHPILDRIREVSPQYGPGSMSVCRECVEHHRREMDIEHQIVMELNTKCLPGEVVDGVNAWQRLIDLMKVWRAQGLK